MRINWNNIFFGVGVVAVIIMTLTFDISLTDLLQALRKAGYWLGAAFLLWGLLYLMNTCSWRIILHGSGPVAVSFLRLYKLTISGFALNYVTPVGLLGGEPYKILELSKDVGTERATSSVILFAMMHIFSHFWYWVTSILTFLVLVGIGDLSLNIPISILLFLAAVFCGFAIYLFCKGYKNGLVYRLIRFLSHIPGLRNWGAKFLSRHESKLYEIDQQIAALHRQNKAAFFGSLLCEYFGRIFQSFEVLFLLLLFGIDGGGGFSGLFLTFIHSYLIMAFTTLFANMLSFIPMQIGGREGGFVISTSQLGMTSAIGFFVSIIIRVRELLWACIGLLLIKIH